jgi:hypothetical protein
MPVTESSPCVSGLRELLTVSLNQDLRQTAKAALIARCARTEASTLGRAYQQPDSIRYRTWGATSPPVVASRHTGHSEIPTVANAISELRKFDNLNWSLHQGGVVIFVLAVWVILGFWIAAAGAIQIITEGLDDTEPIWVVILAAYVLTWILILKNEKVNQWVNRKTRD